VVADAVSRTKAQNPEAVYCLDPVMGDADGLFVDEAIPEAIAESLLPLADIVTPNSFELALLTGIAPTMLHDALAAMQALWRGGPRLVVATSLARDDGPEDAIESIALAADGAWSVAVPALGFGARPGGAGDLFAALFLAHCLKGGEAPTALSLAASATWGVLRRTFDADARELLLVEAQDELVAPEELFDARPVA
jgi:pyridoxine kinase